MDSINYNLGNIRKLLEDALTDQQFYDLLQDKFLYIYDNFKDRKIPEIRRELVDYANKQRKIQVLLDEIKEKNEAVTRIDTVAKQVIKRSFICIKILMHQIRNYR